MKFWNYLDGMQKEHRERGMLFVHGSPRDPVREYMVPRDIADQQKMSECFAKMGDAKLCFIGHSHVPGVYTKSGSFLLPSEIDMQWQVSEPAIVNIGSVGQPRDGDPRASFAVVTDGTVSQVRHGSSRRRSTARGVTDEEAHARQRRGPARPSTPVQQL